MKKLLSVIGLAAVVAGCCTGNCPKDSGTTFARDVLQKYVDSGEMPGNVLNRYRLEVSEK